MHFYIFLGYILCLKVLVIKSQTSPQPSTNNAPPVAGDGEVEIEGEGFCSRGDSFMIIDYRSACCNHNITLVHGLEFNKYWKECSVPIKGKGSQNETYVNSLRRVHFCILSKNLRKKSINLVDYSRLMAANYPPSIRDAVLNRAKSHKKVEASLSNYKDLRVIRCAYVDLQRKVCKDLDKGAEKTPEEEKKAPSSPECDPFEEAELNGGSCCQGQSIPLDVDFYYPRTFNKSLCGVTLAKEFKAWKIPKSDIESALEICTDVCELMQAGILSSQVLQKADMRSEKAILERFQTIAPKHASPVFLKQLVNYAKAHNQTAGYESEVVKKYQLSNSTAAALRPCIGFSRLSIILYDGIFEHCNPPGNKETHRVQTKRSDRFLEKW